MPTDPVCGKTVDADTPYQEELDGEVYYFCSEECAHEFEYSAEEYAEPLPEQPESD